MWMFLGAFSTKRCCFVTGSVFWGSLALQCPVAFWFSSLQPKQTPLCNPFPLHPEFLSRPVNICWKSFIQHSSE